jgi:argininosuccinate lyase
VREESFEAFNGAHEDGSTRNRDKDGVVTREGAQNTGETLAVDFCRNGRGKTRFALKHNQGVPGASDAQHSKNGSLPQGHRQCIETVGLDHAEFFQVPRHAGLGHLMTLLLEELGELALSPDLLGTNERPEQLMALFFGILGKSLGQCFTHKISSSCIKQPNKIVKTHMSQGPKTPAAGSTQLWGGRFEKGPAREFYEFNRSFGFDRRLLHFDIEGSLAHAKVLVDAGILSSEELSKVDAALKRLLAETSAQPSLLDNTEIEDVHSFIEGYLTRELGDLGKKIHSGRSRNDQVATALRLWLVHESQLARADLNILLSALLKLAEDHPDTIIPGYTHLQRAQPILWSHWCLAYAEMILRDRERLDEIQKRIKILPLGSGALAGSSLALNREVARSELGFLSVSANSLDGVSDRDFVLEWQSFASIFMVHLSRLAEDLIIYASAEFGLVELGDEVSSGSSLMPQKKNPDALELIRGKTGRVIGSFMGFLTTVKGLPLAYNKDLQEDKEALFNTADTLRACARNAALVLTHTRPRPAPSLPLSKGFMNATDLADLCVLKGIPFREAHEKVGHLVRLALSRGLELSDLDPATLRETFPTLGESALSEITLGRCLERKSGPGGTAPARVKEALLSLRRKIELT